MKDNCTYCVSDPVHKIPHKPGVVDVSRHIQYMFKKKTIQQREKQKQFSSFFFSFAVTN